VRGDDPSSFSPRASSRATRRSARRDPSNGGKPAKLPSNDVDVDDDDDDVEPVD
jgi:hypothetical protein